MLVSAAGIAVRVLKPVIWLREAIMFAVPGALACATPPLLMEITPGDELVQATEVVTSRELLSVNVPWALTWVDCPIGMDGLSALTVSEISAAGMIETVAEPLTDPWVAVTVAPPKAFAFTCPLELTGATVGALEAQTTLLLMSLADLSEKVPMALNCNTPPSGIEPVEGLTEIDSNITGDATVDFAGECPLPQAGAKSKVPDNAPNTTNWMVLKSRLA